MVTPEPPTPDPSAPPRPRRRRLRPAHLLAAAALLAVGGVAAFVTAQARRDADIARAVERLSDGDAATAEPLLQRHAGHATADAGIALTRALRGETVTATDATRAYDVRRMMDASLRRGDARGTLGLAGVAQQLGDPVAAVYSAAAQAEAGDMAAAVAAIDAAPAVFAAGLGADLKQVVTLRTAGVTTLLRDRSGALLGGVGPAGMQLLDLADAAWIPSVVVDAVRATDAAALRLTLDRELSRLALLSLAGHRGSIVLLDPRTGAVLAAVSDAATRTSDGGTPSFAQRREPASIQKVITAATAYRAGLDADAEIAKMTCNGFKRYGSEDLWCSYPGGRLNGLDIALATSCNVAFADLALQMGRATVVDGLRRFGFDRTDVPWAGRITQPDGDDTNLANLGVGLTHTDITPLHAALLASIFANDGNMAEPTLLQARDTALGLSPQPFPAQPSRPVLDPKHLPPIERAMISVTRPPGTAAEVDTTSFPIAMKTGTASQDGVGYHVNYVGVGRLPQKQIAFALRVTHEGSSRSVNAAARKGMTILLDGLGRAYPPR